MTDGRANPNFVFNPKAPKPPPEILPPDDPQGGLVPTWSYSSLRDFEECQHRLFLSRVKKIKTESGEAADRGTSMHTLAEEFVKGEMAEVPPQLANFGPQLIELRELYPTGKVILEQEWGFDIDWQPAEWFGDNVWGRQKLDVFVHEDDTSGRVIDYKSGKRFGNELKHAGQGQQYAIGTFMRFPKMEFLDVQFWYLDLKTNNVFRKTYTRAAALMFMPKLHARAVAQTSAKVFRPAPSKYNCLWCPFKTNGACQWAE